MPDLNTEMPDFLRRQPTKRRREIDPAILEAREVHRAAKEMRRLQKSYRKKRARQAKHRRKAKQT